MRDYNMHCCKPTWENFCNWNNNSIDYCADYGKDFSKEGLKKALDMIKEALENERNNEKEYENLISMACNKEQKELLKSIRDDERNHRKWLREIYMNYTGKVICPKKCDDSKKCCDRKKCKHYCTCVKKAFFDELNDMKKYRLIRAGLPRRCDRDLLFQILTDEMKHAMYLNYILLMCCCRKKRMRGEEDIDSDLPVMDEIYDIEDIDVINDMDDMEDIDVINDIDDMDDIDVINDNNDEEDIDVKIFDSNSLYRNISPLVDRALREQDMGLNSEYLFSKFILSGALVGEGKDPEDALREVEQWQEEENSNIFIRE